MSANGQFLPSELVEFEGCFFIPDMARRVKGAFAELRALGVTITCNEGYRSLGVPADQYIRNAADTSTGGSNQWFQRGRANRGETPSAAIPSTSVHGIGRAGDFDYDNSALVHSVFARWGLVFTIPNEPWHAEGIGTVTSALDSEEFNNHTPTQEELDEMTANTNAAVIRNYEKENVQGKVATVLLYPNGNLVGLTERDDVDAEVEAHAKAFHLSPDNAAEASPRNKYVQLTDRQFRAFVLGYKGGEVINIGADYLA